MFLGVGGVDDGSSTGDDAWVDSGDTGELADFSAPTQAPDLL